MQDPKKLGVGTYAYMAFEYGYSMIHSITKPL